MSFFCILPLGEGWVFFFLTMQRYGVFSPYEVPIMKTKRTNCELHNLYVLFMKCTQIPSGISKRI